ncbi:MAG: tRNA pseudouridine(55) synthase TruB [Dehalococcoidia bacterium]|nr:MAG: tRNA pseudouridine(55) synthase TruB [Dehalococcoidia bacterium]
MVTGSGFIIINKPSGATSFSMVSLVRRLTRLRRVGHAGTLDPLASGVLPVAFGHATRLIEYLDDELKVYRAGVRFGIATDTYDAEGRVTATADASSVTAADVETALAAFVGDVEQTPPVYSALKVAGRPLYRYAREGAEIEVAARVVHVERVELLACEGGVAQIEVRCGKGTYIRSIAHDLGAALGCGAHLAALERRRSGGFGIDEARAPDDLAELAGAGRLDEAVLAPDRAVERRPAAILGGGRSVDARTGRDVAFEAAAGVELCRAYSVEGAFLGVLKRAGEARWHPEKVIPEG